MRYVYLDNLRAILMLLGVVLHTCAAFSPTGYWLVSYPESLPWVDNINEFIHFFRMPLFFMISGFFCSFLLKKWNTRYFLANKLTRILVPYLSAFIILNSLQAGLIATGSSRDFFGLFTQVGHGHLWFLFNLFIYFCVFAIFYHPTKRIHITFSLLQQKLALAIAVLCFPLIYIALLFVGTIGLDIYGELPILGSLYTIFYYFDYFILGAVFGLFSHNTLVVLFKARLFTFLLLSSFLIVVFVLPWLSVHLASYSKQITLALTEAHHRWQVLLLSGVILVFARVFFQSATKQIGLLFESSYSVYLFHHVLIVLLVTTASYFYGVVSVLPTWLVFFMVLFVSWGCAVLLHFQVVEKSTLGRLLFNGK